MLHVTHDKPRAACGETQLCTPHRGGKGNPETRRGTQPEARRASDSPVLWAPSTGPRADSRAFCPGNMVGGGTNHTVHVLKR